MVCFSASLSETSICSCRCAALRLMNLLCFENSLHKPQMPKWSQSCSLFLSESFPSSRSIIYSVAFLQVICKRIHFIKNYPVQRQTVSSFGIRHPAKLYFNTQFFSKQARKLSLARCTNTQKFDAEMLSSLQISSLSSPSRYFIAKTALCRSFNFLRQRFKIS